MTPAPPNVAFATSEPLTTLEKVRPALAANAAGVGVPVSVPVNQVISVVSAW